ncbi:MAG TPA: hypothetical protein VFY56_00805, partial [Propionibacteriaceae bacterium]|nr:hypothetical protein [Propionibacteriaceae bacterium]
EHPRVPAVNGRDLQSKSGCAGRHSSRRSGSGGLGLMAVLLVLAGAGLVWIRRRIWTDHDVSDPGVTL